MSYVSKAPRFLLIFQTCVGIDTSRKMRQITSEVRDLRSGRQAESFYETLDWLSSLKMEDKHKDIWFRDTPGSGDWFLQHPLVQQWIEQDDKVTI